MKIKCKCAGDASDKALVQIALASGRWPGGLQAKWTRWLYRWREQGIAAKRSVAEIFPLMSEEQTRQFLYRLELSPALTTRALVRLKAELQTLHKGP